MATNLGIDEQLLEQAQKAGKHRTKKEAVNAALDEYVRYRKQVDAMKLFGTIDYDANYQYRHHRRNRKG